MNKNCRNAFNIDIGDLVWVKWPEHNSKLMLVVQVTALEGYEPRAKAKIRFLASNNVEMLVPISNLYEMRGEL